MLQSTFEGRLKPRLLLESETRLNAGCFHITPNSGGNGYHKVSGGYDTRGIEVGVEMSHWPVIGVFLKYNHVGFGGRLCGQEP